MSVLPATLVPARTPPVRVVYGRVRRRRFALVKLPVRVVRWLACAALVRALYGSLAHLPALGPVRVRGAGTDRLAHAGPPAASAPVRVPGVYPARTRAVRFGPPWTTRAKVVRGPGRRSGGGRAAAWVRVPGPYPARTWPGQAALWWYIPGVGRGVDGRRVKYRRVQRTPPGRPRRRGVPRRKPRHMSGSRGRIFRSVLAFRDGPACFYCRRPFADPAMEATFDHYLPSALWLTRRHNAPWNVVLACQDCNGAKGDALPWPLVWLLLARLGGGVRVELAAA